MLGRIYAVALVAITLEALINGFGQIQFLNPTVFFGSVAIFIAVVTGVVITQFFGVGNSSFWLKAVALTALVLLVTWPIHFNSFQQLPDAFQPWIWWTLGISAIAAGTTFRFALGVLYLVFVATAWPTLKLLGFAGSSDFLLAGQEALHLFVFSSVLVALVLALRWEANKTDSANQIAIASAVESAKIDAIDTERARLDALVHDSVLTTLLVAARADKPDQQLAARKLAAGAIAKLSEASKDDSQPSEVTLVSFFSALENRIKDVSPDFLVSQDRLSNIPIPTQVAEALTEATLQAVDNSLKHAASATERLVRLRGSKAGLKIVISDNGSGFRPSQVPKDRMGIASSIVARVQNVGGKVFIDSSPGTGTNLVIEWGSDG